MIKTLFLTSHYKMDINKFLSDDLKGKVSMQQISDSAALSKRLDEESDIDIVFTIIDINDLESLYQVQLFQKKYRHIPLIAIFDTGSKLILNDSVECLMHLLSEKRLEDSAEQVENYAAKENKIDKHLQDVVKLTKRQIDVLKLLVYGKSNKQIARDLHLAEGTVKLHCMAIFKEIGVTNRTQAALKAEALMNHRTLSTP